MIPTSRAGNSSRRGAVRPWRRRTHLALALLCALALPALRPVLAKPDPFPQPPQLERDVQFWIRVYTQIDTNSGFLHDENDLAVVYETLHFAPNTSPRSRERQVEAARDRYVEALKRIATSGPQSDEDRRIRALWGGEGTPIRLLEATNHIRFQLGQSDRFRAGLERAGKWEAHIAEVLANLGLPPELAVLPHVESSFNPAAYSKVGAAGLWQFMRSTGRRYMRIDSTVDDRLDPFRSTEAAAQLLSYNYHLLGTWPLAITAYNHGAAGVRRAVETLGTDDILKILRNYKSPSFGFASRNFYVSFLAALAIDRDPEKYFGHIRREPEVRFQEVALPMRAPVSTLERAFQVDGDTLRELNPALRPICWRGRRAVPKGYHLRLPLDGTHWTPQLVAQRLRGRAPGVVLASNTDSTQRRAAGGKPAIVQVADSHSTSTASGAGSADTGVYVVQRGDSLWDIAAKVGIPESRLLALNHLRDPDYLFEGQQLRVSKASRPAESRGSADTGEPQSAPTLASAQPAGRVAPEVAEAESDEDAEAVASVGKSASKAQPVSAAQADAFGPALGPDGVEAAATTDPNDYSVAKNDTIVVAAAETLGHYADWLHVSAGRLRRVNHMRYGRPVVIGHRIKLDFHRVKPEAFEAKRREYHRSLEASYFSAHRIAGTQVYIVRHGDSLWTVTQRYDDLPIWLLQQYNPDVDFSAMRPGAQIMVPRVEDVSSGG